MPAIFRSLRVVACAALLAILISLVGQGVWTALVTTNLATTPAIPWSVAVMALFLRLAWQYAGGRWPPLVTAAARHRALRSNAVSGRAFALALLAGTLAVVALAGLWIVTSTLVRMPGNVLPDMSGYPPLTVVLAVGMGSLVSPLLEQAGIWGYAQVILEREFRGVTAVLITSVFFAVLPHPPMGSPLWPKLLFYFLAGATFGTMAYLTNSILPGLFVHIVSILIFFTLVWPRDASRQLIEDGAPDVWFWMHVAQAILGGALAVLAFGRLAKVTERGHAVTGNLTVSDQVRSA
jgi:membrane protease YdiL (CAAX protease family)